MVSQGNLDETEILLSRKSPSCVSLLFTVIFKSKTHLEPSRNQSKQLLSSPVCRDICSNLIAAGHTTALGA